MLRLPNLLAKNGEHSEAPPYTITGQTEPTESTIIGAGAQPKSMSTAKLSGFAARRERYSSSLASK